MTPEQEISRGVDAQQVLQNAVYKEAFAEIEQRLLNQLAVLEIEPKRAEYLRQLICMGRKYRTYLEQVMLSGRMAEEQKSLIERAKEKASQLLGYR